MLLNHLSGFTDSSTCILFSYPHVIIHTSFAHKFTYYNAKCRKCKDNVAVGKKSLFEEEYFRRWLIQEYCFSPTHIILVVLLTSSCDLGLIYIMLAHLWPCSCYSMWPGQYDMYVVQYAVTSNIAPFEYLLLYKNVVG